MRSFLVLAFVAVCHGAKLDRNYLPPSFAQTSGGSEFLETPKSGENQYQPSQNFGYQANYVESQRPERPQAAFERNAGILRLDNENDGDRYSYAYETENGIVAEESGIATDGVRAQGGFSYVGDDGKQYSISYTADENGFQPQGEHLPTPPPIPEEILRALEQNARDEAAGIYDDGSYNENLHGGNNGYAPNGYDNQRNNQPIRSYLPPNRK
ncbi:cuticle protein 3-like [Aricia agestis]|uniref:cuticle protein 3-like n=1 Tax=Aricia agestis TaxID=91739 RepID=UPI001C203002|nr:cuticle protein 3-like [Aricia agestis]